MNSSNIELIETKFRNSYNPGAMARSDGFNMQESHAKFEFAEPQRPKFAWGMNDDSENDTQRSQGFNKEVTHRKLISSNKFIIQGLN